MRYRLAVPHPQQCKQSIDRIAPLLAAVAGTIVLLMNAHHPYTHLQAGIAFALVAIPCCAYAEWLRTRQTQIPLFALLAAAHMVFYCLSTFWTNLLERYSPATT